MEKTIAILMAILLTTISLAGCTGDETWYQERIDELESAQASDQNNITALNLTVKSLESNVLDLDATIADLNSQIAALDAQITELKSEINYLNEQNTTKKAAIDQMAGDLLILEASKTIIQEQVSSLTSANQFANQEIASLQALASELNETISDLQATIAALGEVYCGMIWPEDSFKAAVYSFVAEYELDYGSAVGCYLDYVDIEYPNPAIELEDNWDHSGDALAYAQDWVDSNAANYGKDPFDLESEFYTSGGGLGWSDDSNSGNQEGDCAEFQNLEDSANDDGNASSFFEIEENPNPDSPGLKCFSKYVEVFGLGIYAEPGLSDAQVLHAAAILAELLDNDEDGTVDDQALLSRLLNMSAIVPMFDSEQGFDYFADHYTGNGVSAVLFSDEVDPSQPGHWGSDATIEEIMHTINHVGHVSVYPAAFGLEPDSSLLSDAMDVARGGQFVDHPGTYPDEAWYHYDDTTCDYQCMAIEYIYWAQVSNMGILNDTATCDGIANEWEPCSKDLLESMDVLIYALITDSQYHLPQNAPDGEYDPQV